MAKRLYETLVLPEQAAAATPGTGTVAFYAKSDGRLYGKDDAGTEFLAGMPAQIAGNVDVLAGMVTQGLRAASADPPLNLGTGALTAGSSSFVLAAADITVSIDANAGQNRALTFRSAGSDRWIVRANSTAESGSDVGSDLDFVSRTDAGALKSTVLRLVRSTGAAQFVGAVSASSGTFTNSVSTGGTPASTGTMRFSNGFTAYFRNNANSADIKVMDFGAGDIAQFWGSSAGLSLVTASSGNINMAPNGSTGAIFSPTGFRSIRIMSVFDAVASDVMLRGGGTSSHTGTSTTLYGVTSTASAPSTTTVAYNAFYTQLRTDAAAYTMTNARAVYVDSPSLGASSAITTIIGLAVSNQGGASRTNAYGLWLSAQSGAGTLNVAARLDGGTQANLWLSSDTASDAGGIVFGTSRDASIWRAAAGRIGMDGLEVTSGAFQVDSSGRISIGGSGVNASYLLHAEAIHPGSAGTLYGLVVGPTLPSTTTTVWYGVWSRSVTTAAAFTLPTVYAFYAYTPSAGAGSAITTSVGFGARNQGASGVTNAYGLDVEAQSGASTLNVAARLSGGTQANLWLNSDTASAAGGIVFGTARDTTIWRAAAGRLGLDGVEISGGNFRVDSSGRVATGGSAIATDRLVRNQATHPGSATSLYGIVIGPTLPATTTAGWINYWGQTVTAASAFTVPNAYTFFAEVPSLGAGSSITTVAGFVAQNQGTSNVTNAYGLIVTAQSGAATLNIAARLDGGTQANLWLNSNNADESGGIVFGTSRDAAIWRAAAGRIGLAGIEVTGGNLLINANGQLWIGGSANTTRTLSLDGTHAGTSTVVSSLVVRQAFPSTATAQGRAIYSQVVTAAASFTLASGYGFLVDVPSLGAGSAITNLYGISISNQGVSGVSNAYGIVVAAQSGASLNIAARLDGGTQANLWLNNDTASSAGGISFGTARDQAFYRQSSTVLEGSGVLSAVNGFQVNHAAPTAGHYLRGNGTAFVDGTIAAGDLPTSGIPNVAYVNTGNTFTTGTQTFQGSGISVTAGSLLVSAGSWRVDSSGRVAAGGQAISTTIMHDIGSTHPSGNTFATGLQVIPTYNSAQTVSGLSANFGVATAASAFTMAQGTALQIANPSLGAGSAITSITGMYVSNQGTTGITNATGIQVAAQSGAATLNVGVELDGGTQVNLWLKSNTATEAGGIAFGTSRDTSLSRNSAGFLQIGDAAGANSAIILTDKAIADGQIPVHRTGAPGNLEWADAVHGNSHFFIVKNPGAATVTAVGTAAPTLTATAANGDDSAGAWLNSATTNVSGNASGIVSAFTLVQTGWLPEVSFRIKTGPAVTANRIWIGLFSGSPDASATPAVHLAAFRYDTSVDGTAFWRTCTDNASAAPTVTTTTQSIVAATVYLLRIATRQSDGAILFYINGVLVATHTTKLPTTTQLLGYAVRIITNTNGIKQINTGRIAMSYV